jgi:hypothetical protein
MGVGEDFARFKENYNIDSETMGSISYRYRRITRQLNSDFWDTDSETAHSLYVGSYGRDTAARGLSDLDIGFLFAGAAEGKGLPEACARFGWLHSICRTGRREGYWVSQRRNPHVSVGDHASACSDF